MRGKLVNFDVDDAILRYQSGISMMQVAEQIGIAAETIKRRFHKRGIPLRSRGEAAHLHRRREIGDINQLISRYVKGETMKSVLAGTGIGRRSFEAILRENGHQPRTLRQSVGLRYTRMTRHEIRSLVAKAHIAKRGKPASQSTQERRAKTFEATLQLASRADLILAFWLSQRSVKLTPQKAVGPYNVDIAIDELAVAVEVNGSWHYFADSVDTGIKRRTYLLDRGWNLIEVRLTSTSARPWKYLRPACADKIVSLLDELRRGKASWGKYCVIGGDGELLPGEALDEDNRAAIRRPVSQRGVSSVDQRIA